MISTEVEIYILFYYKTNLTVTNLILLIMISVMICNILAIINLGGFSYGVR